MLLARTASSRMPVIDGQGWGSRSTFSLVLFLLAAAASWMRGAMPPGPLDDDVGEALEETVLEMTVPLLTIGHAADQAGVTTRTLRYYEQLDLLTPAGRSVGGARRYSPADVERVARIRQLQDLLGHDLEQIRRVLLAEDRLAEMRAEWPAGASPTRQQELLAEATDINNSLLAQVKARSARSSRSPTSSRRPRGATEDRPRAPGRAPHADPRLITRPAARSGAPPARPRRTARRAVDRPPPLERSRPRWRPVAPEVRGHERLGGRRERDQAPTRPSSRRTAMPSSPGPAAG